MAGRTPNNSPDGYLAGIPYEETTGSGALTRGRAGTQGTRVFFVDWEDRIEFTKHLTGYIIADNNANTPKTIVVPPQRFPDLQTLLCTNAQALPFGKVRNDNGVAAYEYSKVTATYTLRSVSQWGSTGDTDAAKYTEDEVIITQQLDFTVDFLEYGRFQLYWSGGVPIAEKTKLSKQIPMIDHTFTEEQVPGFLSKKLKVVARQGKINSTIYRNVPVERLLYLGANAEHQITSLDGSQAWKVTHKFVENPYASWNKVFNPASGNWESIYDKDGNIFNIYESTEFHGLIQGDNKWLERDVGNA